MQLLLLVILLSAAFLEAIAVNCCHELAMCQLILGDLSRESSTYSQNIAVHYKNAERSLNQAQKNPKGLQSCESEHLICTDEAARLAVEVFKFPAKYRKACNYLSYSRSIFECKNRKYWPKNVANALPKSMTHCKTECIINSKSEHRLSNGKMLFNGFLPPQHINTKDVVFGDGPEGRNIDADRLQMKMLAPLYPTSATGWTDLDQCDNNEWVDGGLMWWVLKFEPVLIHRLYLSCSTFKPALTQAEFIVSTQDDDSTTGWTSDIFKQKTIAIYERCINTTGATLGGRANSFILGLEFIIDKEKHSVVPHKVNMLCANDGSWSEMHHVNSTPSSQLKSYKMVCPNRTAVCSLQAKYRRVDKHEFVENIRIGCCPGDPNHIEQFVHRYRMKHDPECDGEEYIKGNHPKPAGYYRCKKDTYGTSYKVESSCPPDMVFDKSNPPTICRRPRLPPPTPRPRPPPPPADSDCPTEGYFKGRHPRPQGYYWCFRDLDGVMIKKEQFCPPGYIFDKSEPPSNCKQYPPASTDPDCPTVGYFKGSHPNPLGYYFCFRDSDGVLRKHELFCPPGHVFDKSHPPHNCKVWPPPDPDCPTEGYFKGRHPHQQGYYNCFKDPITGVMKKRELFCPPDYIFDTRNAPKNASCKLLPSKDPECWPLGYFKGTLSENPDPEAFWWCQKGLDGVIRKLGMRCPVGKWFDTSVLDCRSIPPPPTGPRVCKTPGSIEPDEPDPTHTKYTICKCNNFNRPMTCEKLPGSKCPAGMFFVPCMRDCLYRYRHCPYYD